MKKGSLGLLLVIGAVMIALLVAAVRISPFPSSSRPKTPTGKSQPRFTQLSVAGKAGKPELVLKAAPAPGRTEPLQLTVVLDNGKGLRRSPWKTLNPGKTTRILLDEGQVRRARPMLRQGNSTVAGPWFVLSTTPKA